MTRVNPQHVNYARQASDLGPLSRRAQQRSEDKFANLFLQDKQEQENIQDAVFRTVGKVVDQKPKLGENPHLVESLKYHRNGFKAREALKKNSEAKISVGDSWQKQSAKSSQRKYVTLDNDPIDSTAKATRGLEEKISQLEERVAKLENGVHADRFSSNPKVSFPENAELNRKFKNSNVNYQLHNKAYGSMVPGFSQTANRISLA